MLWFLSVFKQNMQPASVGASCSHARLTVRPCSQVYGLQACAHHGACMAACYSLAACHHDTVTYSCCKLQLPHAAASSQFYSHLCLYERSWCGYAHLRQDHLRVVLTKPQKRSPALLQPLRRESRSYLPHRPRCIPTSKAAMLVPSHRL